MASAECGEIITVEICMSAAGSFVPPLFVLPRQRYNTEFMRNTPPGSAAEFHKSEWMQKEIFERWLQKFITRTNASKDMPVLFVLDGHSTHTKSIELIKIARDNGVKLLCFPPHCTHKLQPLDVRFMNPESTYYDMEATDWPRSNGGNIVTLKQVADIFGQSFIKAATIPTATNAFKKTGIWPFNPGVFTDKYYMASETTNVDEQLYEVTENCSITTNQNIAIDNTQLENFENIQIDNVENIQQDNVENIQLDGIENIKIEQFLEDMEV